MSMIADGHDIACNCNSPFSHLLASIFPPGHQDRDLTINQILQRDYKEACRSGGAEEESPGMADSAAAGKQPNIKEEGAEEDFPEEELENLLIAAAEEGTR